MNLETALPKELWEAVKLNYEKHNFTGAVLDAFYFLSDLLRDKSGAEGDGVALVGAALGGASPKIKLNSLQSESEQNIQRGIEHIIRGLYQAFRNPRSHGKINDTMEDAFISILFIGYLVIKIDKAKSQFSRSDFIERVFDPDFVPNARYAGLLVGEVPPGQRMEVFLDVFRTKERWNKKTMMHFFTSLFSAMTSEEEEKAYKIISDDLKIIDDNSSLIAIMSAFDPEFWPNIEEVARLRAENKLIRSVRDGQYSSSQKRCVAGALGTWVTGIFPYFSLKNEIIRVVYEKLSSNNFQENEYIFQFIFNDLNLLMEAMPKNIERVFVKKLNGGEVPFHSAISLCESMGIPWSLATLSEELRHAYRNFKAAEPVSRDDDEIPF